MTEDPRDSTIEGLKNALREILPLAEWALMEQSPPGADQALVDRAKQALSTSDGRDGRPPQAAGKDGPVDSPEVTAGAHAAHVVRVQTIKACAAHLRARASRALTERWRACLTDAADEMVRALSDTPIETSGDGWIPWKGGGSCPVSRSARVEVKFQDGETGSGMASRFRWNHEGLLGDIISYRLTVRDTTPLTNAKRPRG